MDSLKDTRWRQRFENYEKSYKLLEKFSKQDSTTELERAGIIQFFEITFELAWKVSAAIFNVGYLASGVDGATE